MKSNQAGSKAVPGAGLALLLAFALAGQMVVFNPEAQAQGKGNKGQNCDDVNVELRVPPNIVGDSVVTSDGGFYPAQLLCNNDTNNLYMATGPGRGIAFELANPSDGGSFTLSTGQVSTNLGAAIADSGGILAMGVGTTATTTRVQFNFVVGSKRYFLSWGSSYPGASTATVAHPDADTWVIETSAQPNNIARLRECPANGACKSPVDRFYFAPLRMELTRVP
ncbi:MAG TPA: hypothetical protein VNN18_03935 [Candidatus Xenobia bacterium]|nr:hypothetical protein [Candidatus Xenobia bacterium]